MARFTDEQLMDALLALLAIAALLSAILYAFSPRIVTNEGNKEFNYTTVNNAGDNVYNTETIDTPTTGASSPGIVTMPCDFDANTRADCTIEVDTGRMCGKCA